MIKVCCTGNDINLLDDDAVKRRLRSSIHIDGPIQELNISEVYTVWSIDHHDDGGLWLYLHTMPEHHFPTPYPAELFDFVESVLPAGWALTLGRNSGGMALKRVSFAEWAHDDQFYERLVDGETNAVAIYLQRRRGQKDPPDYEWSDPLR